MTNSVTESKMSKYYIQRRSDLYLETVDEFYTRTEAVKMLREYRMSDTYGSYYLSTRCCKAWKES